MKSNVQMDNLDEFSINYSKSIGSSWYGRVFEATHIETQQKYAMKRISMKQFHDTEKLTKLIKKEISTQKDPNNEHVVHVLSVIEVENRLHIVTEWCEEGDLHKRMKNGPAFTEQEACLLIKQIAKVFVSMENIIHGGIKPSNILFSNGKVKLTDFGQMKVLCNARPNFREGNHNFVGAPLYLSPQTLTNESFNEKSDVWSTGCIFYELLFGKLPYYASNMLTFVRILGKKPITFPKTVNVDIKDLLNKMLQYDEGKRIGWKEVWEHPALQVKKNNEKCGTLNQIPIQQEKEKKFRE